MKKMAMLVLIVVTAAMLSGCVMPREAFVNAVSESWGVIGPEYVELVEASNELDADAKRIRGANAESLTDLIEAAKGGD